MRLLRISPSFDWFDDMEPVGQDETGDAGRCKMVHHMLDPSEVGVAGRRCAVLPSLVFAQAFTAPVRHVERRISQNVVRPHVRMTVVVKGVSMLDLPINPADGQVHLGQAPRGVGSTLDRKPTGPL